MASFISGFYSLILVTKFYFICRTGIQESIQGDMS